MLRYYHPGKFGRGIGPVMGSLDEVGNEVARRLGLSFEPVTDLRGVSGAGSKNLYNQIAAGPRGLRSGYFTPLAVERDGGFKINPIAIKYFEEELGIYKRMAEFGGPKVYGIGNDGRNLSGLIIEHIEKVPCTDAEMAEALARFADDALDRGSIAADLRPDNVVMTKHGLRPIDVDFVPVGIKRSQLTGGQELKLDNMNLRGFTPSQRFKNARENIFY